MSDGIALVRLSGRLDALAAPTVNAELVAAVNIAGPGLVLDMERVSVIDSTGLSVLLATLKAARKVDGGLWLVAPSQQARSLLQLTGLNRVFKTYESLDAVWVALPKRDASQEYKRAA